MPEVGGRAACGKRRVHVAAGERPLGAAERDLPGDADLAGNLAQARARVASAARAVAEVPGPLASRTASSTQNAIHPDQKIASRAPAATTDPLAAAHAAQGAYERGIE
ncbi:MAG: hypothetical protein ACKOFI_02635, partial [Phycisphaerales bacterium]